MDVTDHDGELKPKMARKSSAQKCRREARRIWENTFSSKRFNGSVSRKKFNCKKKIQLIVLFCPVGGKQEHIITKHLRGISIICIQPRSQSFSFKDWKERASFVSRLNLIVQENSRKSEFDSTTLRCCDASEQFENLKQLSHENSSACQFDHAGNISFLMALKGLLKLRFCRYVQGISI